MSSALSLHGAPEFKSSAGLLSLPEELLEAIVCSCSSARELARPAAAHRRLCATVQRVLRDRSHPIWRKFCANECGAIVFQAVTDYSSLYFKLRKLTPPPIRTIDKLEFIVKVHMLVADAAGGESEELVFSEHLQGMDAKWSRFEAFANVVDDQLDYGFSWSCPAAAKMLGVFPYLHLAGVTNAYQMEAINSDTDFDKGRDLTATQIAARAGRRTWRLSLLCFNPSNQSVYHLLDHATPKPNYSAMGGPGGWTSKNIAFHPQPLRLVFQDGNAGTQLGNNAHMLNPEWHAHVSIEPPQAPPQDGAAPPASSLWRLHFNVTHKDTGIGDDWQPSQPSDLVLTALENLSWA